MKTGFEVCDFKYELDCFWFDKAQKYFYDYDEINRDWKLKPQFNQYQNLIMDFEAYLHLLNFYLSEWPSNNYIFRIAPKLKIKYDKLKKIVDGVHVKP